MNLPASGDEDVAEVFHGRAKVTGKRVAGQRKDWRRATSFWHLEGRSPGCPAGTRERREATELAGRTWEFVEFLTEVAPADLAGAKWDGAITIHDSCHLRGIGLDGGAAKLLGQIEGLTCRPVEDGDRCCGFGGVFATKAHKNPTLTIMALAWRGADYLADKLGRREL